jgi:hypothetical protein
MSMAVLIVLPRQHQASAWHLQPSNTEDEVDDRKPAGANRSRVFVDQVNP